MKAIVKVVNFIIGVFYLIIGTFIVALLFAGDDVPWWQKALVFIGGLVIMFLLRILSVYMEKKVSNK